MKAASHERSSQRPALHRERLGVVRIDGARHSLIWAYSADRSVSLLIDRPEQVGKKQERLVGAFWPDEGFDVVEVLAADYEKHHVGRPRAERIPPRALQAGDLEVPPSKALA